MRNLLGETLREAPSDCIIESQKIMVRGGYIKYVGNGIYSLLPPAKRITKKIEAIIREEMDKVDGQEVLLPVVMPANLWEESGRFSSVGKELVRFKDRGNNELVLGMTHEEAAVHLSKNIAKSYSNYPFMIYQIQTKFRDEPRSRGGLIRVREFTMKDAYSFHTSQESLENYYNTMLEVYKRIFERCGIKRFIVVKSDAGMMGGNISHEFMLLTSIGEDTLAICEECDYQANVEAAKVIVENECVKQNEDLKKVYTPGISTIKELSNMLSTPSNKIIKSVVYIKETDETPIIVFIRGDLEVNETKLRNILKSEIREAKFLDEYGLSEGYIGPLNLPDNITVIYDSSVANLKNAVCGSNELNWHYTGLSMNRDIGKFESMDVAKIQRGFICPKCGKKSISLENGIEIGNIFQLGTKYTESMNMTYLDNNGKKCYPIMGCYGIGIGRLCASICEESHDEYGPIWPITIAPWQIHICCVRSDDISVKNIADNIYNQLLEEGIEVLYDERNVRPGVMFADADLLGIPIRIIISPKNIDNGIVELVYRDRSLREEVPIQDIIDSIKGHLKKLIEIYK